MSDKELISDKQIVSTKDRTILVVTITNPNIFSRSRVEFVLQLRVEGEDERLQRFVDHTNLIGNHHVTTKLVGPSSEDGEGVGDSSHFTEEVTSMACLIIFH